MSFGAVVAFKIYKVFFFLSHRVRNTSETGMFFLPISGTFYHEQLCNVSVHSIGSVFVCFHLNDFACVELWIYDANHNLCKAIELKCLWWDTLAV